MEKTVKPRNPYVSLIRVKRSGAHVKSRKSERRLWKKELNLR